MTSQPQPGAKTTDVIAATVQLAGRRALDVGCGDGGMVAWLLRQGCEAIGLECVAVQAAPALARLGGGRCIVGLAELLPLSSASLDLVFFVNSLHHVPVEEQEMALTEAHRVLRFGGDLVVVEPVAAGSFFELLRPVDDETAVRASAAAAIDAANGFDRTTATTWEAFVNPASFDALAASLIAVDPVRAEPLERLRPTLHVAYEWTGELLPDGRRRFRQPMRLDHLRKQA